MNEEWLEWTRHNLKRGCRPEELRSILKKNGFNDEDIFAAMATSGQSKSAWQRVKDRFAEAKKNLEEKSEPQSRVAQSNVDYAALAQPRLLQSKKIKRIDDDRVQLFTWDNFLSKAECHAIIQQINQNLRPSTVTTGDNYSGFRTSSTCDLGHQLSKSVKQVDKKIANALGIRLNWSEVIQGQKYEVGQEFKAHTDYFEPNTKEFDRFAGEDGQRTWTFMIYLNETPEGGETYFTEIDKIFRPKMGQAVIWNNLNKNGEPNSYTQHHGMPVKKGCKLIITKWFRDKGEGDALL